MRAEMIRRLALFDCTADALYSMFWITWLSALSSSLPHCWQACGLGGLCQSMSIHSVTDYALNLKWLVTISRNKGKLYKHGYSQTLSVSHLFYSSSLTCACNNNYFWAAGGRRAMHLSVVSVSVKDPRDSSQTAFPGRVTSNNLKKNEPDVFIFVIHFKGGENALQSW